MSDMSSSDMMRGGGTDLCRLFDGPSEDLLDERSRTILAKARDFFKEVDRLLKAISLYGRNHPAISQLKWRTYNSMLELLELSEEVYFEVGPYDFLLYDQSIYEDAGVDGSFVYKFYLDGIRRVGFVRGVTTEEMEKLLAVILIDWRDPELFEDDAVTIFWTQEFEHIRYVVVESFQDDIKESETRAHSVAGIIEQVRRGGNLGRGSSKLALDEGDLVLFQEHPFALDETSLVRLAGLIRTYDRETLEKFIEILFRATLQGQGSRLERRDRVVGLFDRIARLLLETDRLGELERLLRKIRTLTGPDHTELPANIEVIQQIFSLWSNQDFVDSLLSRLETVDLTAISSVLEICKLLNPDAAPLIVRATDHLQNFENRKSLLDLMPDLVPGQESAIASLLPGLSEDVALALIRSTQNSSCQDCLLEAAFESSFESVRLASIAALSHGTPELRGKIALKALDDLSRKVRNQALLILLESPVEDSAPEWIRRLESPAFVQLELEEKRRFFLVAEKNNLPDDWLVARFQKQTWTRRQACAELRHCAAVALAVRRHPEARQMFESALGKMFQPKLVVEACVFGLTYLACEEDERRRLCQAFFQTDEESRS